MEGKLIDGTNDGQTRKKVIKIFVLTFIFLIMAMGFFRYSVYCDNNRPFRIELRNDELDRSVAVYMNSSQSWTSVERGKDYEIGAQYDGIIENHMGKDIREWELSIYLPRDGVIDSCWNGEFEIVDDRIVILPVEYNQQIADEGDLTFGFVMYSGELLSFSHFVLTGYYSTETTSYPMFYVLIVLFAVWVFCLILYLWGCYSVRNLELQAEKDRQIISQAMETFAHLVDAKDQYTQEHSIRVALYSEEIARRMGKSKEETTLIKYIALVHDCGKVGVPDAVLNKSGALDGGEREIINSHTVLGGDVLHYFTAIDGIREGALYHHERYDGTGYPAGLSGKKIPLCARIICIADAYDAMSSDRCYRKHLSKEKILEELMVNSGKQFDPDLVRYMISMIEDGFAYRIHHYDANGNEVNNLGDMMV